MKISYNWLKEYITIDKNPEELAKVLTDIGLEIEGFTEWESVKGGMKGVVIGEVLTCAKHPDADKLSVTTVNIGLPEPVQIVCGAPNVAAGQKVAVATPGTVVYKGEESFEIKKSKIRGVVSEGMICAEDELGLGTDHEGIMVLNNTAVPGTPGAGYFNIEKDTIFEIGLTPNRIDSGSHFGVARDLAAYFSVNAQTDYTTKRPPVDDFRADNNKNPYKVTILNKTDCPRYTGITISGLRIGESPDWLKKRLMAIGLNPINNVVDVTNFVQHEIGQPLHAFDADKIDGKNVIIKNLPEGTKFITLDSVERKLSSKDLMICNENEGMCIAGVFGGIKSGVTANTTNIFLESAYFHPVAIRKTSKRHTLKTDASFRFERGADPDITLWALKRAAMLIKEVAGGEISSEPVDVYPVEIPAKHCTISYKGIAKIIGKEIDFQIIKKILAKLDFQILSESNDLLDIRIPLYRVDVQCEADIAEEILRIYGYNNVEISSHIVSNLQYSEKPDREKLVNIISGTLSANGFAEIMCNSLTPSSFFENDDFEKEKLVILANPLSSDLNAMRQSLLHGGLSSVAWNINRQNPDLKLYEFGNCYFYNKKEGAIPKPADYTEKKSLDLFISGKNGRQGWNHKSETSDFYTVKSTVEMIITRLGLDPSTLTTGISNRKFYSDAITYSAKEKLIAEAGKISKSYLRKFDIEQDVFYGHIEWDALISLIKNNKVEYSELPKYPWVRRDLALLVDTSVKFSQIRELAFRTEKHILKEVDLFDVYESDALGAGNKSYAVSFILRDDRNTLTDKSIDKVMNSLLTVFGKELDAKIR